MNALTPEAPVTPASAAQQRAEGAIRAASADLLALSHALSADPETGFKEHRSAARVGEALSAAGFDVSIGVYGLPTAIEASYGSGDIEIAVVGEYDALPDVGHACGHNIIASAGVGAALGLRSVADELGVRIVFLGSPAEENGGGKVFMLERGAWDSATFSLMVHPMAAGQVNTAGSSSQALDDWIVTFRGKPAHAAFAPHEGINAGNAVTLTEVGIGLLRQQMPKDVVISSISKTGKAVNIIPEIATMELEIRGITNESWELAKRRVREVVQGAAMAAGCEVEIEVPLPGYAPLKQDTDLAGFFDSVYGSLIGSDPATWGEGLTLGSTDMGDVSRYLPAIHPTLALESTDASPHQYEFAAAAVTAEGDAAVINGAIALARTAIMAVEDDAVRARLVAAQAARGPHPRGHWATAPLPM